MNLTQRLEELAVFAQVSLDLLCVAGFDGYFKILNPAWERTLGFTVEELLSRPFIDFVHPADRERTLAEAAKLATNQDVRYFENRYLCKDGSYRLLLWTATPSMDKQQIYATARDITDLNREETRKLREANEMLQSLIDASPQAIIALDLNRNIRLWNKAATTIFGWSAHEVIGKSLPFVSADKRQEHETLTERSFREEALNNIEVQRQRRDGSPVDLLMSLVATRDANGRVSGSLAIAADITERKHLQAQLYRAQRLESIGMLASGIAHDLNNILAPILMGVQLCRDAFKDQSAQATLSTIEASAKRGANLVKQVLTFARGLEGARMQIQVRHVLRDVEKIITETFPKSIRIITNLPRDLFPVSADATQLHQVFMNLCLNSRDAMPRGGELSISAQNVFIDENYASMTREAHPGWYVRTQISDTGMGIPKDIINEIFEPFFTTKEVGMGTGLGLSTVYAIVKSHEGFVNVSSEAGKGTVFYVYLPALPGPQGNRLQPVREKLPAGNGEVILVVDDEAAVREITQITLESYGYHVITAAHGAEGVALYAKNADRIQAIICDMNMPIMDGKAMIEAVRVINPTVRILSSSGLGEQPGSLHFIAKPYTAEQLLDKIHELLHG